MMLFNIFLHLVLLTLLLNYCIGNNINKTKLRGQYKLQKEEIINILTDKLYKKRHDNILFHSAIGRNYYETTILCNKYKNDIDVDNYDINNMSSNKIKELFIDFYTDDILLSDVLIILKIYNVPKDFIVQKVIDKLIISFPEIKINEYTHDLCTYYNISW